MKTRRSRRCLDPDKTAFCPTIYTGFLNESKSIGDFRDWDAITAWATTIAEAMKIVG